MGLLSDNFGHLGVDIGKTGIKIVELKNYKGEIKLSTYGYSENKNLENPALSAENADISYIAGLVNKLHKQIGATSHNVTAALPSYSVFSCILSLPPVSKKDIVSAINFEAKKIIPLPIDEMVLDWKEFGEKEKNGNTSYLLTGAPRELVKRYINIFKEAEMNLLSLETEAFSLIRALAGRGSSTVMIVEMGGYTTNVFVVENGAPVLNRSLDLGGMSISRAISNSLKVGLERAEQFKYDLGMSSFDTRESVVPKTISEAITPIINEIKYSLNLFQSKNDRKVEKVIISGGGSLLTNFSGYLSKNLDMEVVIGNPWDKISYPVDLKPVLEEIGPKMAIAAGLALRGVEA